VLKLLERLTPRFYIKRIERILRRRRLRLNPSLMGVERIPAGHFYSPLLDLTLIPATGETMPHDGAEYWEALDLQPARMEAYYRELCQLFPAPHFPAQPTPGLRYFRQNGFFPFADAFTLSALIRKEKPRHIIEVGSGYSSAAMVDTILAMGAPTELTCIEPYPERLHSIMKPGELPFTRFIEKPGQEMPVTFFDQLEARDILFIDSSHVAKIGSDVTYLLLRVLPRLRPGVLIHFHDIFYPFTYPMKWIKEGRAWNESIFIRGILANNPRYEIVACNAYAGVTFPELFRQEVPGFFPNTGGSLWIRKL
jgi:predicted O-methyltransferase YrrM